MKTIYLLLALPLAATAGEPIYKKNAPTAVCTSPKALGQSVQSCEDNAVFLRKAEECWDQVAKLEKQVTKDLEGRIGQPANNAQDQSFGTSGAAYAESSAAHTYMFDVVQQAYKEVDEYFDYVVYPEDAETDDEVMKEACYRDTVVPLDKVADKFEEKLADLAGKIETEDQMHDQDAAHQGDTNSVNAAKAHAQRQAAPTVKGKQKKQQSDVTGVEEDKRKSGK